VAASVHQRLLTIAKNTGQDFGLILTRYGLERLLFRLSRSRHADVFVLKGAMLFAAWTAHAHRPTRDLDFLAHGDHSIARFKTIFLEILSQRFDADGMVYLPDTVQIETMKNEEEYPGLRVFAAARLGKARISLQVDIGFGDAITPNPVQMNYPTLLPLPAPRLATYPMETVVSEKFEAIVKLGIANSRMKDFFDVWALARDFTFSGDALAAAIRATFGRRKTEIPGDVPFAFTPDFYEDPVKAAQWRAFMAKNKLTSKTLPEIVAVLTAFLLPAAQAAGSGQTYHKRWNPGGPWASERP